MESLKDVQHKYLIVLASLTQTIMVMAPHVAGTIGAKIYIIAYKSKLVGVKVLSCTGSGTLSGVIAGIHWVKRNAKKLATANLSVGSGKYVSVNNSGATTVVSAGNDDGDARQKSPASETSAITVASTTRAVTRSFYNRGSCVDSFAHGSSIKYPWIGGNCARRKNQWKIHGFPPCVFSNGIRSY